MSKKNNEKEGRSLEGFLDPGESSFLFNFFQAYTGQANFKGSVFVENPQGKLGEEVTVITIKIPNTEDASIRHLRAIGLLPPLPRTSPRL